MTESRLLVQLESLKNIDKTQAMLPAAHVLRSAAYWNYVDQTDEDAFEDEFTFDECDNGAFVQAKEEFNINFIEFGTSKMAAQPFMRPAIDSNQHEMAAAMKENIEAQMRELIK